MYAGPPHSRSCIALSAFRGSRWRHHRIPCIALSAFRGSRWTHHRIPCIALSAFRHGGSRTEIIGPGTHHWAAFLTSRFLPSVGADGGTTAFLAARFQPSVGADGRTAAFLTFRFPSLPSVGADAAFQVAAALSAFRGSREIFQKNKKQKER